ncbi:Protein of unknown function [Gryllus bimaculatus]|nr:Protein of unknown function [Gryllus bimaculatus]
MEEQLQRSFIFQISRVTLDTKLMLVNGSLQQVRQNTLFDGSLMLPAILISDPCTQVAFQTENDTSTVEHAATASAADAYASLVKGKYLL